MAWTSGVHGLSSAAAIAISHHPMASSHAKLDGVMLFGFISAIATATCYLHRHDGRIGMLTFAASLAATGVYGFIEGAWPLGMLEAAWAIEAARRGLQTKTRNRVPRFVPDLASRQDKYREIFGSN